MIPFNGALLNIHEYLIDSWPFDFPAERWPTFCGAGKGLGDWAVPEKLCGVPNQPCCYDHDVRWAAAANVREALIANFILYSNVRANTLANYNQRIYSRRFVESACLVVLAGVTLGTIFHFDPINQDIEVNVEVKDRMDRLQIAYVKYKERNIG